MKHFTPKYITKQKLNHLTKKNHGRDNKIKAVKLISIVFPSKENAGWIFFLILIIVFVIGNYYILNPRDNDDDANSNNNNNSDNIYISSNSNNNSKNQSNSYDNINQK